MTVVLSKLQVFKARPVLAGIHNYNGGRVDGNERCKYSFSGSFILLSNLKFNDSRMEGRTL